MKHTERLQSIRELLYNLATPLIQSHLDQSLVYNQDFAINPDGYFHHKPEWHEWGILTHTEKFLEANQTEVPSYLQEWGFLNDVQKSGQERIDDLPRSELIEYAILLHDIGKFATRHLSIHQTTTTTHLPDFSFGGHERVSEELILSNLIAPKLLQMNLTENQIIYIGRSAALHYEISKIRDKVKYTNIGYTTDFIKSDQYKTSVKELIANHQDYLLEIAIMYLGDSLGKTSFRLKNDHNPHDPHLIQDIQKKGLDVRNIHSALTLHVPILATKYYLQSL